MLGRQIGPRGTGAVDWSLSARRIHDLIREAERIPALAKAAAVKKNEDWRVFWLVWKIHVQSLLRVFRSCIVHV